MSKMYDPPPPPNQGQFQGPPQSVTIVQQPPAYAPSQFPPQAIGIVTPISYPSTPIHVTCSYCSANVLTLTRPVEGTITYCAAGILCIVGCWLCCCLPFCMDSMQDVEHFCPNCNNVLGKYDRL